MSDLICPILSIALSVSLILSAVFLLARFE